MRRVAIAQNTLEILDVGSYIYPNGNQVDIARELKYCFDSTKCYSPDNLAEIESRVLNSIPRFSETGFEVRNETTLMGA